MKKLQNAMILPLGMKPVMMDSVELPAIDGELFQQLLGEFVEQKAQPQIQGEAEDTKQQEKTIDEALIEAVHHFLRLAMLPVKETVINHGASNEEIKMPADQSTIEEKKEYKSRLQIVEPFKPEDQQVVGNTREPVAIHSEKKPEGESNEKIGRLAGQHFMEEKMQYESKIQVVEPIKPEDQQPAVSKRETVVPFESRQQDTQPIEKMKGSKELAPVLTPAINQDLIYTPATEVPKQVTIHFQHTNQFTQELGETMKVAIQHLPAEGSKVVHVTVTPETFGELDIELTWQDNQVEAVITVEKEEVKHQLLERMDLLKDHLPKNPIVQTITIEVKPPLALFQLPQQPFQERKRTDTLFSSKQRSNREQQKEDEEERVESLSVGHLSLYI